MEVNDKRLRATYSRVLNSYISEKMSILTLTVKIILLTSTENAVEVDFDSPHHTAQEVWPGEDIPSVGHMGSRTAAGKDLDL